ncbi:polyadenylation and cleavage factor homolog 4-like [Trifolium pratense]|uniref:polyadenylation and cleavage factor homolog 4-like n=1 Tax=Trifolium pratense TaxID=57577 RepID=UPI001E693C8E|nr:polyadenylation and cleavage factor homolog 4-like [Trifolium pratense]
MAAAATSYNGRSWQNTEEDEFDWDTFKRRHPVKLPCQLPHGASIHARPVMRLPSPDQSLHFPPAARPVMRLPSPNQSLHFPLAARPVMRLPLPGQSLHFPPAGGPHAPPQMLPRPNPPFVSSQHPSVGYSSLINSLMAQGVISLANQTPTQDFVGIEFDPNILKVRHESVVSALYVRRCGSAVQRHWELNQLQLQVFLPTEEKKEDKELAVPAEEDQKTCSLCGEYFDQFYSDETEDWMYRGAVYLNAPNGIITAGMDRSQLGPIIHAKCRSESTTSPSQDCVMDGEGNQRKRMQQGTYDEASSLPTLILLPLPLVFEDGGGRISISSGILEPIY